MTTPITPEELAAIKAQPHKSETVTRLLDEVEAMRPVVEAAVAWRHAHTTWTPDVELAIDAYEARTEGEG